MKKVLFCGLYGPTHSDAPIADAFRKHGYEVVIFDWQHVRFSVGDEGMKARLITLAQMEQPDLIFLHVQVPDALDPETCEELSKIAFTIHYTFDVRNDISWYKEIGPYLGLMLFACQEDVDECKAVGIENCFVLQSASDTILYRPLEEVNTGFDIAFIGSNYVNTNLDFPLAQERYDMVQFLKKQYAERFYCKGMNWEESRFVKPDEEVSIYNSVRIGINHNNFLRTSYTSDRIWRIMSCGCFCLTAWFPGIEKIFEKEIHLDWFHNLDELKTLIDFYLDNDEERKAIAKAGSLYVRENHTWYDRISELKTLIEKHGFQFRDINDYMK